MEDDVDSGYCSTPQTSEEGRRKVEIYSISTRNSLLMDIRSITIVKRSKNPGKNAFNMNSAAVPNDGPTRVSLFPFPLHHETAGDYAYTSGTPAVGLAQVENSLGLRHGRDGFVCDNVRRVLAYRAGVMAGVIDVEAV